MDLEEIDTLPGTVRGEGGLAQLENEFKIK